MSGAPEIPALSPDATFQRVGGPGAEAYRRIIAMLESQLAEANRQNEEMRATLRMYEAAGAVKES